MPYAKGIRPLKKTLSEGETLVEGEKLLLQTPIDGKVAERIYRLAQKERRPFVDQMILLIEKQLDEVDRADALTR